MASRTVVFSYLDWHALKVRYGYTEDVESRAVVAMGAVAYVSMSVAKDGDGMVRGESWSGEEVVDEDRDGWPVHDECGYIDAPEEGGGGSGGDEPSESGDDVRAPGPGGEETSAEAALELDLVKPPRRREDARRGHCMCWHRGGACCHCGREDDEPGAAFDTCLGDHGKVCVHKQSD